MRPKRFIAPVSIVLVLATVVAAGCTDPAPSAVPDGAVVAGTTALAASDLPMQGWYRTAAPGALIPPGAGGAEERCSAQGLFTLRATLEGLSNHAGRFTAEISHCTAEPIPGPADMVEGRALFTAANGDQIACSYSGSQGVVDPATGAADFEVEARIEGGTGRFAEAAGQHTNTGIINYQTGELAGDFSGWITY